jgi:hypothetical protein
VIAVTGGRGERLILTLPSGGCCVGGSSGDECKGGRGEGGI